MSTTHIFTSMLHVNKRWQFTAGSALKDDYFYLETAGVESALDQPSAGQGFPPIWQLSGRRGGIAEREVC